jgi:hypothetical protein
MPFEVVYLAMIGVTGAVVVLAVGLMLGEKHRVRAQRPHARRVLAELYGQDPPIEEVPAGARRAGETGHGYPARTMIAIGASTSPTRRQSR